MRKFITGFWNSFVVAFLASWPAVKLCFKTNTTLTVIGTVAWFDGIATAITLHSWVPFLVGFFVSWTLGIIAGRRAAQQFIQENYSAIVQEHLDNGEFTRVSGVFHGK